MTIAPPPEVDVAKVEANRRKIKWDSKLQTKANTDLGERSLSHDNAVGEKEIKSPLQKTMSTMCHQCQRNDKGRVV